MRPPNVDAGACWAACCTPAGTVQPLSSAEAIYRAIEGRWLFCSPATWVESFAVPTDAVGIEFGPGVVADGGCGVTGGTNCGGGDVYLLVNGPSGPVRGLGFAYQWTYDIGGYLQFNLHPGYAAIAGRWQFCSQQNLKNTFGAPPDSVGIEFVLTDPGDASCSEAASGACGRGNVYYLVQGPSGPVRGAGFDYQLTFNAFPIAGGVGGPTYQLDLTTTGSYLTNIRYSPCPTEIAMTGYGVDTPVILVPLY
ncbi:MAG TPA: hypothetical protein VH044_10420 [Polyangiaceae bacterium]|nr:hypothetical protein [Polyangiaceae bacterium]